MKYKKEYYIYNMREEQRREKLVKAIIVLIDDDEDLIKVKGFIFWIKIYNNLTDPEDVKYLATASTDILGMIKTEIKIQLNRRKK